MDGRFERGHKRSMSELQVYLKICIMRMNIIFSDIWGNSDTHLGSFFSPIFLQQFVATTWLVLETTSEKSGSRSSGFTSQLRFLWEENPKMVGSAMGEYLCIGTILWVVICVCVLFWPTWPIVSLDRVLYFSKGMKKIPLAKSI